MLFSIFVLTTLTETFPVKKTKANLQEVTSYLAPKPGLKPCLKLNSVVHEQTRSSPCCPQQASRCWQVESVTQQLHRAHNNGATVRSNVSFLISIPNWKANAAPQRISSQQKTNAYQRPGVWEEEECIISSQLSSHGFSISGGLRWGNGSKSEGTAANLLGAYMRRGLT